MSFDFKDSKGGTITASLYQTDNKDFNKVGLYANEPAPTFFNLASYVKADSAAISNPFSYLLADRTKAEVENHIASVNDNISWVWGDWYTGGLAVYKTSSSTLGCFVITGYGTKKTDENIVKFFGSPLYTSQDIQSWQSNQVCVLEGKNLDQTLNYRLAYPYVNNNGIGSCRQCSPDFQYQDVTNPDRITSVDWIRSSTYYRLDNTLIDSTYFVVQPLIGDNYTMPYLMACSDDVYFSSSWETPDDSNYNISGTWFGGEGNEVERDPNDNAGTSTTGGGYGIPSSNSDDVGFPPDSQFENDAYNSGFIAGYVPTLEELRALNDYLFTGITEAASLVIKRIMQNPMDFIISLGLVHYMPDVGTTEEIKFCGLGTGVFAQPILSGKQIKHIDMGSINVEQQFNTFVDYQYSKFKIYLPYCGTFNLSPDDVMKSTISLRYYIDNFTGNCTALVNVQRNWRCEGDSRINSVLYRFTGNAMTQMPISATNWNSYINGALSVIGGAGNIAAGNAIGGLTGAIGGILAMHPDVERSGTMHTVFGFMDQHKPYLICERPIQSIPSRMANFRGYVSNITIKLNQCKGFTKVSNQTLWSDDIPCTLAEMEEIKQLYAEGVWQ